MKEQLLQKNDEIEIHIETIAKLNSHLKKIEDQSNKSDSNSLVSTVEKLKQKNSFLENQLNSYINKVATLENEKLKQGTKNFTLMSNSNGLENNIRNNNDNVAEAPVSHKPEIKTLNLTNLNSSMLRIQEIEIENLQLEENMEYMNDKFQTLQNSHNTLKYQFEMITQKSEITGNKVKEHEDDRIKYLNHAKKLEEQLKQSNLNLMNLHKKSTQLERENKELFENLKISDNEKKNYLDKWSKLSNKIKADEKLKKHVKNLETDLILKNNEADDLRDKYASNSTELLILKETERTYKDILEANAGNIRELNIKFDNEEKDKRMLLKQNLELIEKLEALQLENIVIINRKKDSNDSKKQEENNEFDLLNKSISSMKISINRLQTEKIDLSKALNESLQLVKSLELTLIEEGNMQYKIQQENNETIRKYQLLKEDYEKLQESNDVLMNEKNYENELLDNISKKKKSSVYAELSAIRESVMLTPHDSIVFQGNYQIEHDELYLKLSELIDKTSESGQLLISFIESIKKNYYDHELQIKYDRLLLKYYKANERIKTLEKSFTTTMLNSTNTKIEDDELIKSIGKTSCSSSILPSKRKIIGNIENKLELPVKPGNKLIELKTFTSNNTDDKNVIDYEIKGIIDDSKENNDPSPPSILNYNYGSPNSMNSTLNLFNRSSSKRKVKLNLEKTKNIKTNGKSKSNLSCILMPIIETNPTFTYDDIKLNLSLAPADHSFVGRYDTEDHMNYNYDGRIFNTKNTPTNAKNTPTNAKYLKSQTNSSQKKNLKNQLADEDFIQFKKSSSHEKINNHNRNLENAYKKDRIDEKLQFSLENIGNDRRSRLLENSAKMALRDFMNNSSIKKERRVDSNLKGSTNNINRSYLDLHQNKKQVNNNNSSINKINISNILKY